MCTTESVVLGVTPRNKKDDRAKNGDTNHKKGRSSRRTSPRSNNSGRPYEDAKEEITILRENSESFSRTDSIRQVSPRYNDYTPRNESYSRFPIKSKSLSPRKRSYSNSSRSLPSIPRSRDQSSDTAIRLAQLHISSVNRTRGHSLDSDSLKKVCRPLKSRYHDVPTSRPRSHSGEYKDASPHYNSPFYRSSRDSIWRYDRSPDNFWRSRAVYNSPRSANSATSANKLKISRKNSDAQSGQQAYSTPRTLPRHQRAASWTDARTYNSYRNQVRADERQSPSRRSSPQSGQQAYSTPRTLSVHRRAASYDYTPERRYPSGNQAQIKTYFQQQPYVPSPTPAYSLQQYTPSPTHVIWSPVYSPILVQHGPVLPSPSPHYITPRRFVFPTHFPSSEERHDNARLDSTQARKQRNEELKRAWTKNEDTHKRRKN